jgi:hypothetical protein
MNLMFMLKAKDALNTRSNNKSTKLKEMIVKKN